MAHIEAKDVARFGSSAANVATPGLAHLTMREHWRLIDDLYGGTRTMRAAGEQWLPRRPKETRKAYDVRLSSSVLYAAMRDAIDAVANRPFVEAVKLDPRLPERLSGIEQNADGAGTSLTDFAREVLRTAAKYGLCHVLVDFPKTRVVDDDGEVVENMTPTLAEEVALGLQPRLVLVSPKDLLGWRSESRGSETVVTEARIAESLIEVADDGHSEVVVRRVRVLREEEWELWREGVAGEWSLEDSGVNSLGLVPLVTFYSSRTGHLTGEPPFEDLAWLNVAHWQSSSLQRNSLDIARIPILVRLGFTEEEADDNSIVSTSVSMTSTNTNASVKYVEHSGAALAAGDKDLQTLREQMEVLGLQPWMRRTGTETATGVASVDQKATTEVQAWVRGLEATLLAALRLAGRWVGVSLPDEQRAKLFDDFGLGSLASQQADLLLRLWQSRAITLRRLLVEVRRRGVLGEDFDVDRETAEAEAQGEPLSSIFGDVERGGLSVSKNGNGDASDDNDVVPRPGMMASGA